MNNRKIPRIAADRPANVNGMPVTLIRLLDSLPFYAMLVDGNHTVLVANKIVNRDLGLDPHALLGQFCPNAVHGCEEEYPDCPLTQVINLGGDQSMEKEIYDKETGRWSGVGIYPTGLKTEEGIPIFLHFTRDITEKKEQELARERSLEHHRSINQLLTTLQGSQKEVDAIEILIEHVLNQGWACMDHMACGFVNNENGTKIVSSVDIPNSLHTHCSKITPVFCPCSLVVKTGKPVFQTGLDKDNDIHWRSAEKYGHAAFPLGHEGSILGAVNFYLHHGQKLKPPQIAFLETACSVTASAVAHIQARRMIHRTQELLLKKERKLLAGIMQAQENERKRIARELHDQLGQSLSALLLDIPLPQNTTDKTSSVWKEFKIKVKEIVTQTKNLAWDLRPSVLDNYGIRFALEHYFHKMTNRSKIKIDFEYVNDPHSNSRLNNKIEVALYRIAQEALTNVIRHANATRVSVILVRKPKHVSLVVEDDGIGFHVETTQKIPEESGLGLIGMNERASLLGGELFLQSTPGEGTMIRAQIPLYLKVP